ncbi:MAG: hypothetical protein VB934_03645, partial [Polyangiaceae bacterium]
LGSVGTGMAVGVATGGGEASSFTRDEEVAALAGGAAALAAGGADVAGAADGAGGAGLAGRGRKGRFAAGVFCALLGLVVGSGLAAAWSWGRVCIQTTTMAANAKTANSNTALPPALPRFFRLRRHGGTLPPTLSEEGPDKESAATSS